MKKLIILCLLLISSIVVSQKKFEGKATYMTKTTIDMSRFGNNVSEAQKKQWMARMKNFLEKTYTLSFNQNESSWKEDVKLDAPGTQGMRWGASNGQGSIYKNFANAEMVEDIESFSKRFRIQEKLEQPKWQMTAETKKIGKYTCYKATLVKADDRITMSNMWRRMSRRRDQDKDSTKTKEEDIRKIEVTAWFTPEIPVKTGPAEYYGLPGLILELNAGRTTMLCTEIVLNPEESITIDAPSKGKEVSRDEYNKIIKVKSEEMRERFQNRRRGGRRF
jgi:GLPGLI family protein